MTDVALWSILDYIPIAKACRSYSSWETMSAVTNNFLFALYHLAIIWLLFKIAIARKDFTFTFNVWAFVGMNALCSGSRFVVIWYTMEGDQTTAGNVRLVTSFLCLFTIIALWSLVREVIKLPSTKHLEDVNKLLNDKIIELDQALNDLRSEKAEKEKVQASLLQAQKMEAVGRLTGGIAHDFNNLLLSIGGNLELIKMNPDHDKAPKWLNSASEAVTSAAHLTAQLLTFSRVQKIQLKDVRLQPLLVNLKGMIKRTLGPTITIALHHIPDVIIRADSVQLELAILNLAINSRDAMPDGGNITVWVSVVDNNVEINVEDTGTGIPDNVIAHVFEPFFTTKDMGKGTGLGLSMVYGVATQSGGNVYIKQTSVEGTTVTLQLPLVKCLDDHVYTDTSPSSKLSAHPKSIVLIDDDHGVRETIKDMLVHKGHSVKDFEDGPKALGYLKSHTPDLVLVDYAMPVMNGEAVMKAIKLIHPNLPIIFVTGYSASVELEGHIVLKKPFKIEDLDKLMVSTLKPVTSP